MSKKLKARDVMHPDPITVRPETPIAAAIRLLIEHRISGLPVVDPRQRIVGMITEKDMLRVLYEESGTLNAVSDLMTTRLRVFQADDPLEQVVDCLMANHFRRVPVIDGERLVGLISRADLMETILEEAEDRMRRG
jgi:CBS domain-containing protein